TGLGSGELQVINVSVPASPTRTGVYNAPGAFTPIAGFGTTLLAGQGNTLYVISVATPAAPTVLGTLAIGGAVNDIAVNSTGSVAYLATQVSAKEFEAINLSDLAAPALLGSVDIPSATFMNGVCYNEVLDEAVGATPSDAGELMTFIPQ
ncbi:MAG TPA: hypothetical protein VM103_01955, partial [Candidatus Paceibacterota bacterium]|nr:hypothetical protein [Candidatus Paceibacterota bacterium]